MKSAGLAIIAVCVFAATEAAALCGPMNCNGNKTCQQQRAAGHCAAALAAGGTHYTADRTRTGNMRRGCGTAGKMAGTC